MPTTLASNCSAKSTAASTVPPTPNQSSTTATRLTVIIDIPGGARELAGTTGHDDPAAQMVGDRSAKNESHRLDAECYFRRIVAIRLPHSLDLSPKTSWGLLFKGGGICE